MRYAFGEFILDTETGELLRAGEVIALRRQTFRLLRLMTERAPALLSRDELLDEVWGRTALSPNALPQAISELRRALGDNAQTPQYIETRHGRGYRFVAPVQHQGACDVESEDAESRRNAELARPTQSTGKANRWLAYVALLVGVLIISGWLAARNFISTGNSIATAPGPVSTLALASLPASADVPAWVSPAALELFGQHLSSSRLRLVRGDALGLDDSTIDTRWQHQAHDLLGAQFAAGGRWRRDEHGSLALDLSVINLSDGQIVTSRKIVGSQEKLDALVREASSTIAEALHIAPLGAVSAQRPLSPTDGASYEGALKSLSEGRADADAEELMALHARLGKPQWIESTLLDALVQAGEMEQALALIDARLDTHQSLPLGERLRLQARAATLRHQPAAAAAALRALVDLYPEDVESAIALIKSEIDALQGTSARKSLERLSKVASTRNDPRMNLLRSQLARLDNNFSIAQREAATALQIAHKYDLPQLAIAAAIAESDALYRQGNLDEGARLLAQVDGAWADRVSTNTLLDLRISRIRLLREQGDLDRAQSLLDELPTTYATAPSRARIRIEVALLQIQRGRPADADISLQQIKPIIDSGNAPDLTIAWHNADALAALAQNNIDHAKVAFTKAFALARANGRASQHVGLQVNAGLALMRQKRFVEADQQWQQALETFEALGDRRGQATCLGNLAASASTQGQLERSVELNIRALDLFRELNLPAPLARTAYNLALAATRDGKLEQAENYFKEAGAAWQAGGQHDLALRAVVGQAEIALATGKASAAQRILDAATHVEAASPLSRSHALAMAARIALARGNLDTSQRLHEQALSLRLQDGNEGWIALSELELLRNALLAGGDSTRVQISAESLAKRFAEMGERRDEARAWLLVADARLSRKKIDAARDAINSARRAVEPFSDRNLEFDLEWAEAWASDRDERVLRLQALRQRAKDDGYLAQALRAQQALTVDPSDRSRLHGQVIPVPPYAQHQSMTGDAGAPFPDAETML